MEQKPAQCLYNYNFSIHHGNLPCQDGRAVQGAAFRSQSRFLGVGSNPTSDNDHQEDVERLYTKSTYFTMADIVLLQATNSFLQ